MNLRSGRILNQYRLIHPLSNASHPVWLGYDLSAERDVVLKFFHDKQLADRERIMMIDGDHPHMIKLLCVFTHEDATVLVMEHQPGQGLHKIWETLDHKTGLAILIQIASVLEAIHQKGMWHGDVSHLNVHYDAQRKKAFLLDYAFEKKCALGFQAPEDFEENHRPIGRPTDIYRFGRLIELLTPKLAARFQDCFYEDPDRRPTIDVIRARLARATRATAPKRRLAAAAGFIVLAAILAIYFVWLTKPMNTSPAERSAIIAQESGPDPAPRVPMNFWRDTGDDKPAQAQITLSSMMEILLYPP